MLNELVSSCRYINRYKYLQTAGSTLYKYNNKLIKETNTRNEIDILKKINHPKIINVLDSYQVNNKYNLVMNYYEKGDLYDNIYNNNIDIDDKFIKDIIEPIEYLHSNNIVHLDIKLENYLLDNIDNYILIDFYGAMKHEHDYYKQIETEKIIYTKYYASPEYVKGYYSKSSDIYSLGVLLYTSFTRNILDIENINRCIYLQRLPYRIEQLIKQLLKKNPYDRPTIYDIKQLI